MYVLDTYSVTSSGELYSPELDAKRKMSDGRIISGAWSSMPPHSASGMWTPDTSSVSMQAAHYSPDASNQQQLMPVSLAIRPLVLFCGAYLALGAGLWVIGLVRDSLALVGLGFLIVFDGLGMLCTVWMQITEVARRNRADSERREALTGAALSPVSHDLKRPFGYVAPCC